MRVYKNIALITAIVLVALLALGSCEAKTPAVFTSTPAGLACIELMKKVPVYYESFYFWDVKTLRSDPDLVEVYQLFYDRRVDHIVERFGIDSDGIDYLTEAETATLMTGDFDLDVIRGNMPVGFTRDTNYETLEVWQRPPSQDWQDFTGGVILAEGLFIWGANTSDVYEILPVYEGKEPSMYDESAAEVLERLPVVLVTSVDRYPYPEGLIISAMAFAKEDKGTYRWIWVYKFESPEYVTNADAEEYFQGIEDEFKEVESVYAERGEPCPYQSFTLEQDGEFVEWSVIVAEEYVIYSLFYG
jgi:hypothetical protein